MSFQTSEPQSTACNRASASPAAIMSAFGADTETAKACFRKLAGLSPAKKASSANSATMYQPNAKDGKPEASMVDVAEGLITSWPRRYSAVWTLSDAEAAKAKKLTERTPAVTSQPNSKDVWTKVAAILKASGEGASAPSPEEKPKYSAPYSGSITSVQQDRAVWPADLGFRLFCHFERDLISRVAEIDSARMSNDEAQQAFYRVALIMWSKSATQGGLPELQRKYQQLSGALRAPVIPMR